MAMTWPLIDCSGAYRESPDGRGRFVFRKDRMIQRAGGAIYWMSDGEDFQVFPSLRVADLMAMTWPLVDCSSAYRESHDGRGCSVFRKDGMIQRAGGTIYWTSDGERFQVFLSLRVADLMAMTWSLVDCSGAYRESHDGRGHSVFRKDGVIQRAGGAICWKSDRDDFQVFPSLRVADLMAMTWPPVDCSGAYRESPNGRGCSVFWKDGMIQQAGGTIYWTSDGEGFQVFLSLRVADLMAMTWPPVDCSGAYWESHDGRGCSVFQKDGMIQRAGGTICWKSDGEGFQVFPSYEWQI